MNLNVNENYPIAYSYGNKNQSSNNNYCTKPEIKISNNHTVNFKSLKNTLLNIVSRPKTEEAVIKKLSSKKSGCYYKVDNRYKKISSKEFNKKTFDYNDVIIKQPKQKHRIYPNSPLNYEIREGISPLWILKGLKKKIGSITIIAQNNRRTQSVQKLTLPKNDKDNHVTLGIVEQFSNNIKNAEKQRRNISFPNIPDSMYDLTNEIITDINCKDITLERKNINKIRKPVIV